MTTWPCGRCDPSHSACCCTVLCKYSWGGGRGGEWGGMTAWPSKSLIFKSHQFTTGEGFFCLFFIWHPTLNNNKFGIWINWRWIKCRYDFLGLRNLSSTGPEFPDGMGHSLWSSWARGGGKFLTLFFFCLFVCLFVCALYAPTWVYMCF